jgi:hypothetical protein
MIRTVLLLVLTAFVCEVGAQVWATPQTVTRDTSRVFAADSLDSTRVAVPPREDDELKIVRREHNYRRQVGLALFMMAFVALMMTTADAFNPR